MFRPKALLVIIGLTFLFLFDDVLIIVVIQKLHIWKINAVWVGLGLTALAVSNLLLAIAVFRVIRKPPVSGAEGLIGERGVALTTILDEGKVSVHGEIWTAESEEKIGPGMKVVVEALEGLRLRVRRLTE